MPAVDVVIEARLSETVRARQIQSAFDIPPRGTERLEWRGDLPIDDRPWSVGLIVGPSGCGKSTLLGSLFGKPAVHRHEGASVIDDFPSRATIEEIVSACQAVGFNTIPAWLRPYSVLSGGEKFRVDMALALLGDGDIVIDEFTSVVDRQVARIGSFAMQKHVRRAGGRRMVVASCHYDIIDWLEPDWVLEPATMTFNWRGLRGRPKIECSIGKVPYSHWGGFSRFHYLTADLHRAAQCFVLFCDGRPAVFGGVLHRVHEKVNNIKGLSRLVTLPDFQGLGLAFAFVDRLASAYRGCGFRFRTYPAHPSLVRSFDRSPNWRMVKKPWFSATGFVDRGEKRNKGRPCAVFEWCGPAMEKSTARGLLQIEVNDR